MFNRHQSLNMAKTILNSVLILLFCVFISSVANGQGYKKDRVRLTDIQTLTLQTGKQTTGRRTRPIPQLLCVGGTARCTKMPRAVQCYNRGSDGSSIQWECKAELEANLRLEHVEVICEGYDYPEDDYVLAGSCGLEYTVDFIDPSLNVKSDFFSKPPPVPKEYQRKQNFKSDKEGYSTTTILVLAGAVFIVYYTCLRQPDTEEERQNRRATPSAPPPPGFRPDFYGDQPSDKPEANPNRPETGSNSWGFWPGFGIGNLTGYLFGQRNANARPSTRTYEDYSNRRTSFRRDTTPSRDTTPQAEPSTRMATGFGGTRRR
ncbi:Store-operated calcium entry-associated regulatory factor [Halotydeus destructor]|nr:Store-operated calcium entry-associated regulatory factor [Halotydeus destructor]